MDTNRLKEFKNYIINIKGYSHRTYITYFFYLDKLNKLDNNYEELLNRHANVSNNTKRVILSSIKTYFHFINDERWKQIELPKKDRKVKDYISVDEYKKILDYLYTRNKINLSKIVLVRLLFETGIRSCELLSIKINNIKDNHIKIYGKNKKERVVYFSNNLKSEINQLILKDNLVDNLFNFQYKNLNKKIKILGNKINKKLTPHMFRRGFATYCIDKNIGIYEISLMMGHENINTTKLYLRNEHRIEIMKNIFSDI